MTPTELDEAVGVILAQRVEEGLPATVTDPSIVARLAMLLAGRDNGAPKGSDATTLTTSIAARRSGGRRGA